MQGSSQGRIRLMPVEPAQRLDEVVEPAVGFLQRRVEHLQTSRTHRIISFCLPSGASTACRIVPQEGSVSPHPPFLCSVANKATAGPPPASTSGRDTSANDQDAGKEAPSVAFSGKRIRYGESSVALLSMLW